MSAGARLIFVCECGRLPITNMFDVDGNEVADPALANTVVARLPNGQWLAAKCFAGEIQEEALQ